jgi:hypothetical protein
VGVAAGTGASGLVLLPQATSSSRARPAEGLVVLTLVPEMQRPPNTGVQLRAANQ